MIVAGIVLGQHSLERLVVLLKSPRLRERAQVEQATCAEVAVKIGRNVAARRKATDCTQARLAERVGVDIPTDKKRQSHGLPLEMVLARRVERPTY